MGQRRLSLKQLRKSKLKVAKNDAFRFAKRKQRRRKRRDSKTSNATRPSSPRSSRLKRLPRTKPIILTEKCRRPRSTPFWSRTAGKRARKISKKRSERSK